LLVLVVLVMHTRELEHPAAVAVVVVIVIHGTTKLLGVVVDQKVRLEFRLVIIPLLSVAVVLEQQQITE
jgi:hypothetical protein